ncbi:MAG: deoxyguanosinetriphosphate triphosphohydrolase family protein [Solirubrobacterales bacterium]
MARVWVPEPDQTPGDLRDPFERDRARIIHSVAFRRLQGKTQIFTSSTDFLRTRVTHTIEVAQIGRALAKTFGVNDSLVEATCLGHDLGHPPFGHTGEEVLAELLREVASTLDSGELQRSESDPEEHPGSFEGNAQSFRIVTRLEQKSADYPGLDLCRATLLGLIKYPYRGSAGHSKFLYDDDAEAYEEWLFEGTGHRLLTAFDPLDEPPRTLPCQLMDWADDIAYSVHDLEDGIASEMLQPWRWNTDSFIQTICDATADAPIRWREGKPPSADVIAPIVDDLRRRLTDPLGDAETVPPDVIRDVTRHYIDKFATAPTLRRIGPGDSLFDYKLEIDEAIRIENQVLKTITFEFVIDDAETRRLGFKGKEILRSLFGALFENTLPVAGRSRLRLFPRGMRDSLDTLSATQAARAVCDYLAGMTEGQALHLYARLFEPSAVAEFGHV